MATTALRDARLTPGAKVLFSIIVARCGKGLSTSTCKTTLGDVMGRSPRQIGRYLVDLVRFGYLKTTPRTDARRMFTGLIIGIVENLARPFFFETQPLAEWIAQTDHGEKPLPLPDRTLATHINQNQKIPLSVMAREDRRSIVF